jgi:hypothetical protein
MLVLAAVVVPALGCAREPASIPSIPVKGAVAKMDEVQQEIKLTGFDPKGEPVIRIMADGSLLIVFNFMPPSFVPDGEGLGPFADFDKQLERAARVPVVWDDREVFVIQQPKRDTVQRIRKFIESYRGK